MIYGFVVVGIVHGVRMKDKQQIIDELKKSVDKNIRPKEGIIADYINWGIEMGVIRVFYEMRNKNVEE